VEILTEAAQFPEKEYMNGFFLAVLSLLAKGFLGHILINITYLEVV
jgi:hypothetical protein